MADVALSAASPLAALLAGLGADTVSSAPTATAADPFAALLAASSKSNPLRGAVAPKALAPVSVATVLPKPELAAAGPTAELPAGSTDAKDGEKDDDALSSAIDAGPVAVLALAPTFLPPVATPPAPPPAVVPVQQNVAAAAAPVSAVRDAPALAPALPRPAVPSSTQMRSDGPTSSAPQQPAVSGQTGPQAKLDTTGNSPEQQHAQHDAPPAPAVPVELLQAAKTALDQNGSGAAAIAATAMQPQQAAPDEQMPVKAPAPDMGNSPLPTTGRSTPPQQQQQVRTATRARSETVTGPRSAGHDRKHADTPASSAIAQSISQPATGTTEAAPAAPSAPVHDKGDAVVQQTLSIARNGAWLDRLARDIATTADNGGNLHFKLDPQHLGALSVAITHTADGASIRLVADNDVTRNILLDAQPRLMDEARAQGLRVSDTQVDLSQNQQQQNQSQNHQQNGSQDASRWAQNGAGQNNAGQNPQNRQSSPPHQPFVSNPGRKADPESESQSDDPDARYA